MLGRTTLALAAAMAMVCARAEAAPVTFTLVNTIYNDIAVQDGGFRNGNPLGAFQLTIDSAAIAQGSFRLVGFSGPGPSTIVGDTNYFISATTPFSDAVRLTGSYSSFGILLSFNTAGAATGTIDISTSDSGVSISGGPSQFSGNFGSDQSRCGASLCRVTGHLLTTGYTPAAVPEPISAALLLTGLTGLSLYRRRR